MVITTVRDFESGV